MRNLLLGLVTYFLILVAHADPSLFKNDHPDSYTVVKGDTLWDISSRFLNDPWLWPEIWHINPQVKNPHLIFPGDEIGLVYLGSERKLTIKRRGEASRTVKLTPSARIQPIENAIPAIPLEAIKGFLTDSRIVEEEAFRAAPYIVSAAEGRLIAGSADQVYARGPWLTDDSTYGVYRKGERYVDPDTRELLGFEAREIGNSKVLSLDPDVRKLRLSQTKEEVRIGDRLLPLERKDYISVFSPSSPLREVRGKIISVFNGVKNIGQFDVVVINRGSREMITEGNVMAIYQRGKTIKDPVKKEKVTLPAERAGLLMVFRVFDKVSYGLVLKAERSLSVLDEVRNP